MNSEAKTTQLLLEKRIEELERTIRRIPSRFAGGGAAAAPSVYIIAGGKTLAEWGLDGGKRIVTAIAASSLPVGSGGVSGDTIIVPSNPIPAGLPDGICVGARASDGVTAFILCDSSCGVSSDLVQGDVIFAGASSNLDKVSGGITYRYAVLTSYARMR